MLDKVTRVSLVVRDQEEARRWYVEKLGFEVRADERFDMGGGEMRWVTVAPPGQTELEVLLEPLEWGTAGDDPAKEEVIGRNGFVVTTDDCRAEIETLRSRGVEVLSEPEEMPWGVSAVIADLYGNTHNVLEPRGPALGDRQ